MFETVAGTVLVLVVTAATLAVLVPLGLCYLLARQVAPRRPFLAAVVVLTGTLLGGPVGFVAGAGLALVLQRGGARRRRGSRNRAVPTAPALGRRWAAGVTAAQQAAHRFESIVGELPDGPLRAALADACRGVEQAVAEARRLAGAGSRAEGARRDVTAALAAARRRRRRHGDVAIDAALVAAQEAQRRTEARLAGVVSTYADQLELVVARLDEIVAHALELAATPTPVPSGLVELGDRVAALRLAVAEVETVAV